MSIIKSYVWRKKESPDIEEGKSIGLKFTGDKDKNGTLKAKVDREAKKYRVLKASRNDEPWGKRNLYKWWLDVEDTDDSDVGDQLAAKIESQPPGSSFSPVVDEDARKAIKTLEARLDKLSEFVHGVDRDSGEGTDPSQVAVKPTSEPPGATKQSNVTQSTSKEVDPPEDLSSIPF